MIIPKIPKQRYVTITTHTPSRHPSFTKRTVVDETFPHYNSTQIGHDISIPTKRIITDNASSIFKRRFPLAQDLLQNNWFQD